MAETECSSAQTVMIALASHVHRSLSPSDRLLHSSRKKATMCTADSAPGGRHPLHENSTMDLSNLGADRRLGQDAADTTQQGR